jgi:hypothetical protein
MYFLERKEQPKNNLVTGDRQGRNAAIWTKTTIYTRNDGWKTLSIPTQKQVEMAICNQHRTACEKLAVCSSFILFVAHQYITVGN